MPVMSQAVLLSEAYGETITSSFILISTITLWRSLELLLSFSVSPLFSFPLLPVPAWDTTSQTRCILVNFVCRRDTWGKHNIVEEISGLPATTHLLYKLHLLKRKVLKATHECLFKTDILTYIRWTCKSKSMFLTQSLFHIFLCSLCLWLVGFS